MQAKPIYEFSYLGTETVYLLFVMTFGLLSIVIGYEVITGGASWVALVVPLAFAILGTPLLIALVRAPVKGFSLFEDRMTITGTGTRIDRPYSDLTEISLVPPKPRGRRRERGEPYFGIKMGIRGGSVHFRIAGESDFYLPNSKIPVANKDLYTWLVEKSKSVQVSETEGQ